MNHSSRFVYIKPIKIISFKISRKLLLDLPSVFHADNSVQQVCNARLLQRQTILTVQGLIRDVLALLLACKMDGQFIPDILSVSKGPFWMLRLGQRCGCKEKRMVLDTSCDVA